MKKLMVLAVFPALLLAGCRGMNTPAATTSVSGTVVEEDTANSTETTLVTKAWTGGAGAVQAQVLNQNSGTVVAAATGSVAASGAFSLTLPSVPSSYLGSLTYEGTSGCTNNVTLSDSAAMGTAMVITVDASRDGTIAPTLVSGQVDQTAQTGTLVIQSGSLLYSDRSTRLTGTETCRSTANDGKPVTETYSFNLNLAQGWNILSVKDTLTITTNAYSDAFEVSSGSFPTNNWLFTQYSANSLARLPGQFQALRLQSRKTLGNSALTRLLR